jgi:hypothetical protein
MAGSRDETCLGALRPPPARVRLPPDQLSLPGVLFGLGPDDKHHVCTLHGEN